MYYKLFFVICISGLANAQLIISKPVLTFSYLCQSQFVNTSHQISFTVSPIVNINSGNVFTLEMSLDNFATAPVVVPNTVSQSGSLFTMAFSLPVSTYGTNYRLRVKSSSPSAFSPASDAFDAYYIKHNQEIELNTASGIDNISFCSGGNLTLFIFNSGSNSSPLFYPELTYVWKKRQLPSDVVIGTGSSISINQVGQYYVETNYGICSSSFDSRSRIVTVSSQVSNPLTITSSVGNQICEGTTATLTASLSISSNTFKWYNGTTLIPSATSNVLNTTTPGTYKVTFDDGVCLAESNIITLSPITFTASINQSSPISLSQGESASIIVTTSASVPTFQWFANGSLLPQTSNTLTITSTGTYKVVITQTTGCVVSKEIEFIVQREGIHETPNLISPNNDGLNDKWVLPSSILTQQDIKVQIFNSSGKLVLTTTNYTNNWPENESDYINSNAVFYYIITKENNMFKEGTITVIK
jgi:gliding motility-associated-like protein